MNKSTTSLNFPDVNVWLAILHADHVHRVPACSWWERVEGQIVFTRLTQIGLLRLLTTAAAMKNAPLAMADAWRAYDRLFEDDRVGFIPSLQELRLIFANALRGRSPRPNSGRTPGCWRSPAPSQELLSPSTGRWPVAAPTVYY